MHQSVARTVRQWSKSACVLLLYACATLQLVRYYCRSTIFYLHMNAYMSGKERLPFQKRVLPIVLMRAIERTGWLMRLTHQNGVFTRQFGAFYLVSLVALVVAGIYTQKLYTAITHTGALSLLVYPVLLFTVMWTYCIHLEADYSYPYDMLSVAFFAAGLFYIYRRRYLPLLLVMLIGTWNRETTLFLIPLYMIDAASVPGAHARSRLSTRFDLRQLPLLRAASLLTIWLAIQLFLGHLFAHNDGSESFVRVSYNLHRLTPRLLPALLNICGYTLPLVVLFRRSIRPIRFANYLLIMPVWIGVMFYSGVLVETRIYGELCSFCAVAVVVILEHTADRKRTETMLVPTPDQLEEEPEPAIA